MRFGTVIAVSSLAMLSMSLTDCSSLLTESATGAAGIAGAGIAGAISRNAVVGAAIGIGVKSVADVGVEYARRVVHRTEQDNIAKVAGGLSVGATGPWDVAHDLPIERDEHGRVYVVRDMGGDGLACREIVFSVEAKSDDEGKPPEMAFYTATVCRDGEVWKWASPEPAVERWGGLQ